MRPCIRRAGEPDLIFRLYSLGRAAGGIVILIGLDGADKYLFFYQIFLRGGRFADLKRGMVRRVDDTDRCQQDRGN